MSVESLELDELNDTVNTGEPVIDSYMDLIKNVKVNLEVFVGGSEISVGDLVNLKENSVIQLDKDLAAPLEILLDGKLVARGTLAAVEDNFAIQITEVSKNAVALGNR